MYLLGELYIDTDQSPQVEDLVLYHPVTGNGNRVKLHYARPEDLAGYPQLVAIRGEIMLRGWGQAGQCSAAPGVVVSGGEGREGGDAEGVEMVVLRIMQGLILLPLSGLHFVRRYQPFSVRLVNQYRFLHQHLIVLVERHVRVSKNGWRHV